ncbi:MAG: transposase, partial [Candidatus Omnitrophica bacterium]|nr:transposase [Candidatus Omnitrophota bacterium]
YKEHPTQRQVFAKVTAYEFIAMLIQHIPPKGLKLIRHYGLYARVKIKKVKQIIDRIFEHIKAVSQEFFSFWHRPSSTNYRERLQESFGIDPFRCPNCGHRLILYEIWHPKYGKVYDIYRDENWKESEIENVVEKETACTETADNLSLFEM